MEKTTFDLKADQLVVEFFDYTQSSEFKQLRKAIFNVNYDVKGLLETVELDIRDRLRILQSEMGRSQTLKISMQDLINFILYRFFKSEIVLDNLISEYLNSRQQRKKVKNQPTTSNLTAENRDLVNELCAQIKVKLHQRNINHREICLRFFVDYLLTKFIKEYYI